MHLDVISSKNEIYKGNTKILATEIQGNFISVLVN